MSSLSSSSSENSEENEKMYCLCRQPYDATQFYIGCDYCPDWFHGCCVDILECEVKDMNEYICPNCQKSAEALYKMKKQAIDPFRREVNGEPNDHQRKFLYLPLAVFRDFTNIRSIIVSHDSHENGKALKEIEIKLKIQKIHQQLGQKLDKWDDLHLNELKFDCVVPKLRDAHIWSESKDEQVKIHAKLTEHEQQFVYLPLNMFDCATNIRELLLGSILNGKKEYLDSVIDQIHQQMAKKCGRWLPELANLRFVELIDDPNATKINNSPSDIDHQKILFCSCWDCHDNRNISWSCSTYARSFHESAGHLDFQKVTTDAMQIWQCIECTAIEKDLQETKAKKIDVIQLNKVLKFVLNHLQTDENLQLHFQHIDYARKCRRIVCPMDFQTIASKLANNTYQCCESFYADIKWIVHNTKTFKCLEIGFNFYRDHHNCTLNVKSIALRSSQTFKNN